MNEYNLEEIDAGWDEIEAKPKKLDFVFSELMKVNTFQEKELAKIDAIWTALHEQIVLASQIDNEWETLASSQEDDEEEAPTTLPSEQLIIIPPNSVLSDEDFIEEEDLDQEDEDDIHVSRLKGFLQNHRNSSTPPPPPNF